MKTLLYGTLILVILLIAIILGAKYLPNPCDDQCKIAGLQADMNKECYDYRGANELCVEWYNDRFAELSTKGD